MGKLLSQHHRGPEASSSGSRCCLMQELRAEEELCSQPGRGGSGSWHRGLDYAEDFDPAGQDCSATKLLSENLKQDLSLTQNNPVDAPSYPRLPKIWRRNSPH
ncbi:uncharacterized protein ACOB8E_005652 [Sarcophilus harrisii]